MTAVDHATADEGDTITLTATFRNADGDLATPITTTFAQRTPTQTEDEATSATTGWTTASTGVKTRTVALTTPGLWRFEARGEGNGVDEVHTFAYDVRASLVS